MSRLRTRLDVEKLTRLHSEARRLLELPEATIQSKVPSISAWSALVHLHHVALVNEIALAKIEEILAEGNPGSTGSRGGLHPLGWLCIRILGFIPRGRGRAPEVVIPPPGSTREAALCAIQARIAQTTRLAPLSREIRAACGRRKHFVFGYLRASDWLRFAIIHTHHHLRIVQEILHASKTYSKQRKP